MNSNQYQQYLNRLSGNIKEYNKLYSELEKEYITNYQGYFKEYQQFSQSGGGKYLSDRLYPTIYSNFLDHQNVNTKHDQIKWLENKFNLTKNNYDILKKANDGIKTEWKGLRVKNKIFEWVNNNQNGGYDVNRDNLGELMYNVNNLTGDQIIEKLLKRVVVQKGGANPTKEQIIIILTLLSGAVHEKLENEEINGKIQHLIELMNGDPLNAGLINEVIDGLILKILTPHEVPVGRGTPPDF